MQTPAYFQGAARSSQPRFQLSRRGDAAALCSEAACRSLDAPQERFRLPQISHILSNNCYGGGGVVVGLLGVLQLSFGPHFPHSLKGHPSVQA